MTIQIEGNEHDVYYCHSCDTSFQEPRPWHGYIFLPSENSLGFIRDDDGDFLIPGDTKILVGKPGYACHNDDWACLISESDWTHPTCEQWVCSCGNTFDFDNDCCSHHAYSTSDDALNAARTCCNDVLEGEKKPEAPMPPEKPVVGEQFVVLEDRPQGSAFPKDAVVQIDSVGDSPYKDYGYAVSAHVVGGDDSRWSCYSKYLQKITGTTYSVDPAKTKEVELDEMLNDKFKPKTGEKKKVTVIEF